MMAKNSARHQGKIPVPAPSNGMKIKAPPDSEDKDAKCPVFSFRHVAKGYDVGDCKDSRDRLAVASRISELSKLTWNELQMSSGHHGGFKHEPQLKGKGPARMWNDTPIAFRLRDMKPIIGIRDGQTFYVLWIDHSMNLYKH